jgi:hypothetical protein
MNTQSNNKLYTFLGTTLIQVAKVCHSYNDTLEFARTHEDMVLIGINDGVGHFCRLKEIKGIKEHVIKTTTGSFLDTLIEKPKRRN